MQRPIMSDRYFRVIQLKAMLFDAQAEMGKIRVKMEGYLQELNSILKEGNINEEEHEHSRGS